MGIFGDYAQKYWEYGLNVIPCDGQASNRHWKHLQDSRQTQEELQKFIDNCANDNIAITLGKGSGIVAFDLDVNGLEIRLTIEKIIPPTPAMKFGMKGMTYFYKWTEEVNKTRRCKNKNGKQLFDFLSTSSYTVIPPSLHPKNNNAPYVWIGQPLIECIEDLPTITIKDIDNAEKYLKSLKFDDESISNKKEGRNNSLVSFVAAWYSKITSIDILVKKTIEYDKETHPDNPLFSDPEENSTTNVEANAFRFVSSVINSINTFKDERGENKPKETLEEKYPSKATGFFNIYETKKGMPKETPDYRGMANYLKDEVNFIYSDGKANYFYENGLYRYASEDESINFISNLSPRASAGHAATFYREAKMICYKKIDDASSKNRGYINMENGILEISTGKLLPHSPEWFFQYKVPHVFDPNAKCPAIDEFLKRSTDGDDIRQKLLRQMSVYILEGSGQEFEKMFYLIGPGGSGKGTFLKLLVSMVGESNCSSTELNMLDNDYHLHTIDGKLLNVTGEFPKKGICINKLKSILSYEPVNMADKHKPVRSKRLFAKFLASGNGMPRLDTGSNMDSVLRRTIIAAFDSKVSEENQERNLAVRLQAEIPGFINSILPELAELKKTNKFAIPQRSSELLGEFAATNDSVTDYMRENIKLTGLSIHSIKAVDLYIKYSNFCKSFNKNPCERNDFYNRVRIYIDAEYVRMGSTPPKMWDRERQIHKTLHFNGLDYVHFLDKQSQSPTN